MLRKMTASLLALCFLFVGALPCSAQQQVGIPVKIKEAFVLEFAAPHERLLIDTGETNFTTGEVTEVTINAATLFRNKKDAPLERGLLRPGMKIEIQGERFGSRVQAGVVKVKTNAESWEVEVKGYFEKLDGGRARVDGQTVVLGDGAVILGDNEWKGKTFKSFNEMMLGSHVEVKGIRRADGVVYAQLGKTKPNIFTEGDKRLVLAVQQGLLLPPTGQLTGARVKIADKEFKLVESLELQSYVTQVGYKLIPRYIKDLPNDDPGKPTYRFYVIEDDSFNAFALPDGSIFVHTGLLKTLKNEAQMAAVLGHEIAHVTHEHSRRRMESLAVPLLQLGTAIAGAATKNNSIAMLGQFGAGVLSNKFGRDFEDQADRVGLFYMYEAGYDPREAPKVWREVSKHTKENAISNFLYSDHSSAIARLRNLNREIAYNYHETDFSQTNTDEDKYRRVVGQYFGWLPKIPATNTNAPPQGNALISPSNARPAPNKTVPGKAPVRRGKRP
jgi:hypothetical protein